MKQRILTASLTVSLLLLLTSKVAAQTSAFSYQGILSDGGNPANATYNMQFKLFDAASGGTQIGATITNATVQVTNGIFVVQLDFGADSFPGADRFVEVGIRPTGSSDPYTVLAPRQQIVYAPYSIQALNATTATNATQLGGVAADQYILTSDARLTDERNPLPNSANYIQNSNSPQASSNFNISGDGAVGGTLSGNAVNAATQYNLGGQRILSNAGLNNLFAGVSAGECNTGGGNSFFGAFAGLHNAAGQGNSFFGLSAGGGNVIGSFNSFFGLQAGTNNTASNNSFFGAAAGLNNTTGTDNAFFGYSSGSFNTASRNSFFGSQTGSGNTSGVDNTFVGYQAGLSNSTGGANTFIGTQSGRSSAFAILNTFVGYEAGFSSTSDANTFIGATAGLNNTTGRLNGFFGINAGRNNTTGSNNSFIGADAGQGNTTGSNNTAIGYFADFTSGNLDHATAIGVGATVSTSNTIMLGRSFTDNVIVGNQLTVQSIPPGGSFANQVCFTAAGDLLQCTSSLRFKTNMQPFRDGLNILRKLRPIRFNWKESGQADVGLGAEEVAQVAPLFVAKNSKNEVTSVNYAGLSVVFINAIKEQQQQIEAQQRQIKHQQQQIKTQQEQIDELKQAVCAVNPTAKPCR